MRAQKKDATVAKNMINQKNIRNRNDSYDVICIGAGSGGLATGLAAATVGLRVAVVDKSADKFGGECLHDGCIPSKALIHLAGTNCYTFQQAITKVKEIQARIYEDESPKALEEAGVDTYIGHAKFVSNNSIVVNDVELRFRKIVIATGSSPRELDLENHAKVPVVTNQEIFDVTNPTHLLIIGGGPIGCELAQAFRRLGVMVTIVQRGDRLLEKDVPRAGKLLKTSLESEGVQVILNGEVTKIDYGARAHVCINGQDKTNAKLTAPVSHVLLAVGRVFNTPDIGLENTTVKTNKDGEIQIDKYLQTSVRSIVMAGDVTRQPLFSHMAEEHARTLLTNWLSPINFKKPRLQTLPWVTFTDPAVAKFGYSKDTLEESGRTFRELSGVFSYDDRALTDEYADSEYELYIGKTWYAREYLLGGTVVAPEAGELVQELMLLAEGKLSLSAIRNKFYAYPTKSRFWQRILLEDQSNRLLTDKLKHFLQIWYRLIN